MEEKGNYNSNKTKLIAKDIWSEEIPAVVEKKTTLVCGLNGIFQSLFNRVKAVNIRPFFKWNFGFDLSKLDKNRELNGERELNRETLINDLVSEIEANKKYSRIFGKGLEDKNKEISIKAKDKSILVEKEGISINRTNEYECEDVKKIPSSLAIKKLYTKICEIEEENKRKYARRVGRIPGVETADYRKSVIALCSVDNTYINNSSWSSGVIHFKRSNGLIGLGQLQVHFEKKYNSEGANYSFLASGVMADTESLRAVTFTYKGKKYAGIEYYIRPPLYNYVIYEGEGNFDVFGIDFYDTRNNTIINREVYNSISISNLVSKDKLKFNGYEIPFKWRELKLANGIHTDNNENKAMYCIVGDSVMFKGIVRGNMRNLTKIFHLNHGYVGFTAHSAGRWGSKGYIRNGMICEATNESVSWIMLGGIAGLR